jgi:hypothetical protein
VPYLCPQKKPYPSPRFSQPINSQVLAVTMTSRASDLWLSVLNCNDHGSSVCLSGLGMLIDPQNINATVHIIKCSDSNKELGSRIRKIFGTRMFAVLFVQNHTFPYRLIPHPEFPIACSENSCTQNRIKINPINENGWNRKYYMKLTLSFAEFLWTLKWLSYGITGLESPIGFQEGENVRFPDNRHINW